MQQHLDLMELIPHSGIRAALARRDAMLVLSHDLQTSLWANDAGAHLLGESAAHAVIGQDAQLSPQTRRQILALDLNSNNPQNVMLRLAGGLHSSLQHCVVTPIKTTDMAEPVLLITAPSLQKSQQDLQLPHHYAVQVKADGSIIHADAQFEALNINRNTLSDLTIEVQDEADGIVRRRVRAGERTIPAMMIRLDDPADDASYLFIVHKAEDSSPAALVTPAAENTIEVTETIPAIESTAEVAAPARFIWKVDADSRFTEISPEFAAVVGNNAADIIGRKFSDVAKVFGFDNDGTIAILLNQRETWSGKRIFWPVQGTNQRMPVDLAALPAFARDKEFTGFSGFGVLYPSLAENDPENIGMALISGALTLPQTPLTPEATAETTEAQKAALASEKIILMEALRASQIRNEPTMGGAASAEPTVAPVPYKANVIAEIRPARPESGLSPTERNAFREIADRLRREVLQKSPKPQPAEQLVSEGDEDNVRDSGSIVVGEVPQEQVADVPYPHDTRPANHNQTSEKPKLAVITNDAARQEDEDLHVLSGLPVPVLIHSADRLHFANQAFFDMTGYASLDDLRKVGGIDALFAQADDTDASGMILCLANGGHKTVEAHLQSVPWQGARALMLSLLPELVLKADNDDSLEAPKSRPTLVTVAAQENPVHQVLSELSVHSADVIQADDTSNTHSENRTQPDFQALQTQIDELTSILDTATDGVVIIGQDGKIRSLNQSAAALFGYDVNELEGKSFAVLFAIESQRAAIDYIHGLSGDGVASLLNDGREVIGREAQGRFIPLFMTIGKLPASKGYCAVMRDITQWKRAEEELTSARQEAERASTHKTEFLARISHEIRTPLNAIIGFSELMAEEKFGPIGNDRYREYLRDIHRSGNHVLALVNDLLDISKIEAGALDLEFEAVALNDALAEAVALMQPQANRERVIIRSSFSAFLPDIVADARSIRQVALNLLSNAIRFTGQGGQVIVSTSYEPDGQVIMRVRDTGIGMNQSEFEQALKPFRQVSNHNNQTQIIRNPDVKDWRSQGTGLGLPLTKAMVEANRAQFTIESAPEQGTTVEIAFPPTRVLAE